MTSGGGWQPGAAPTGVLSAAALLGRDGDADELRTRCADARVVTLLGPGGAGKTSLAAAVAPEVAASTHTTAWWVDLQPLDDGDRVAPAIAEALGIAVAGAGSTAATQLAGTLGNRGALLVLDNCEHLVQGVAAVLDVLLPTCPNLRILTTSRQVIGVADEQVVRLPPLAVPAADDVPDPRSLLAHAGTALFLDRAGLDPATLDEETRAAVVSICRQVDGLPLAIELAAARSPALPPMAIEAALEDRFRLLTSRRRTVADRQRTLEASIGWSYGLLDDDERRLLRALAVFPAGFDLVGAAAVGADGDEGTALDLISALIDKSLVAVQQRPSGRRYRLLESVRAFGEQELRQHDELGAARERHLDATRQRLRRLQLSERHEDLLLRGEPWLAEEFDDVRAAAAWAAANDRHDVVLDLWWAVHVWAYVHYRPTGPWTAARTIDPASLDEEHRVRQDVLLTYGPGPGGVAGDPAAGDRAVAQLWDVDSPDSERPLTAWVARLWSATARAWAFDDETERSAADARLLAGIARDRRDDWGDLPLVATAVTASRSLEFVAHPDESLALTVEAAAVAEAMGSPFLLSTCHLRAAAAASRMMLPEAAGHVEQALAAVPSGWEHMRAWITATSGHLAAMVFGDVEATEQRLDRYGDAAGAPGSFPWLGANMAKAGLLMTRGHLEEGIELADRVIELSADRGNNYFTLLCQASRARALARLGRPDDAVAAAEEAYGMVTPGTDTIIAGFVAQGLVVALVSAGRPAEALDVATDMVDRCVRQLHLAPLPFLTVHAAAAMADLERHEDAARTLGVLDGELEARGAGLWPELEPPRQATTDACRAALGEQEHSAAVESGRALTWSDWSMWLSRGQGGRDTNRPSSGWAALTDAETEVAQRAAEGLTNAELAAAMFISVNTVKTHLKHVYAKLDVHSRVELANVVADHR